MNSRIAVVLLISIMSWPAAAQSDTSRSHPSWFMTIKSGALFASNAIETAPSVSTAQGIRYGRYALSAGVAYDTYTHWRTLPIFTGVTFDFVRRAGYALYLQMDAGYSKAWYRNTEEGESEVRDAGGHFYHPAIGYRGGFGKVQIHISAGYKIQNIQWLPTPWWWGGWNPPNITITQQIERLSFLIGIGLH